MLYFIVVKIAPRDPKMTQERAKMTQDELNKSVLNPHFEAKIPSRPRWAGGDADDPMGDGLI